MPMASYSRTRPGARYLRSTGEKSEWLGSGCGCDDASGQPEKAVGMTFPPWALFLDRRRLSLSLVLSTSSHQLKAVVAQPGAISGEHCVCLLRDGSSQLLTLRAWKTWADCHSGRSKCPLRCDRYIDSVRGAKHDQYLRCALILSTTTRDSSNVM